jgi:hypothetical protein
MVQGMLPIAIAALGAASAARASACGQVQGACCVVPDEPETKYCVKGACLGGMCLPCGHSGSLACDGALQLPNSITFVWIVAALSPCLVPLNKHWTSFMIV